MSNNNKPNLVLLTFAVCVAITFVLAIIICIWRTCAIRGGVRGRGANEASYDELDQEEIEFKRMIESHGGHLGQEDDEEKIDDLFSFDSKDKDRLNMLENFRSNLLGAGNDSLKGSVNKSAVPTENESDLEANSDGNGSEEVHDEEGEKLRL
jgi:hypothetical protein